jgi:hypothetical protein
VGITSGRPEGFGLQSLEDARKMLPEVVQDVDPTGKPASESRVQQASGMGADVIPWSRYKTERTEIWQEVQNRRAHAMSPNAAKY